LAGGAAAPGGGLWAGAAGDGVWAGAAGGGPVNTFGPPPTSVGQLPQSSTTVSGTVTAWPTVACRTVNVVLVVAGGRMTVKLPVRPGGWPGTSMRALVAASKRMPRNWL